MEYKVNQVGDAVFITPTMLHGVRRFESLNAAFTHALTMDVNKIAILEVWLVDRSLGADRWHYGIVFQEGYSEVLEGHLLDQHILEKVHVTYNQYGDVCERMPFLVPSVPMYRFSAGVGELSRGTRFGNVVLLEDYETPQPASDWRDVDVAVIEEILRLIGRTNLIKRQQHYLETMLKRDQHSLRNLWLESRKK